MRRIRLLTIFSFVFLSSLISSSNGEPPIKIDHVASIPCFDPQTQEPFIPLGLDILPDGRLIVVDGDHSLLWVVNPLDSTFKLLFDCSPVVEDCKLIDLAVLFPTIICSESQKRSLFFLDMQGQVGKRLELEREIAGIAVSEAGDVFGCASLDQKIVEISRGFSSVEIHLDEKTSYPMDCTVLRDGRIAITDNGTQSIRLIDQISGKRSTLKTFRFENPWGIDVLGDMLVVSDAELKAIVVIDMYGNLIGKFDSNALRYPTFLACGSNGQVFVSDQGNLSIEVFKIDEK